MTCRPISCCFGPAHDATVHMGSPEDHGLSCLPTYLPYAVMIAALANSFRPKTLTPNQKKNAQPTIGATSPYCTCSVNACKCSTKPSPNQAKSDQICTHPMCVCYWGLVASFFVSFEFCSFCSFLPPWWSLCLVGWLAGWLASRT